MDQFCYTLVFAEEAVVVGVSEHKNILKICRIRRMVMEVLEDFKLFFFIVRFEGPP